MFTLVLMGHGRDGILTDGKTCSLKLTDIYKQLSNKNFPMMAGKPKWVIVEACSGQGWFNLKIDLTMQLSFKAQTLQMRFC